MRVKGYWKVFKIRPERATLQYGANRLLLVMEKESGLFDEGGWILVQWLQVFSAFKGLICPCTDVFSSLTGTTKSLSTSITRASRSEFSQNM